MAASRHARFPTIALELLVPRAVRTGGWVDVEPDESILPGWPFPQTSAPAEENFVAARLPRGVEATLEGTSEPHALRLILTKGRLLPGDRLEIVYGDRSGGSPGWRLPQVPASLAFRLNFMPDLDTFAPERDEPERAAASEAHRFLISAADGADCYVGRDQDARLPHGAESADWTRIGASGEPPRVKSVYYLVQQGPYHQDWPVHGQFELFSVHEGNGVFTVGSADLAVTAGSIVLIKPFRTHATRIRAGHNLKGINIYFSPGSLLEELETVDEAKLAASSGDTVARIASLAVDIMEENHQLLPGAHDCADAYLELLLVECFRDLGVSARSRREPELTQDALVTARLEQCTRYIGEHFHEELTLELLAEELAVSPWHLSHIFSRHTGTTISAHITAVRMRRAAELVTGTSHPLKGIASLVGYSDEFYFSKVFKRHFGMPPGAYRRARAGR